MALAMNLAWCTPHHARFMARAIYYVKLCLLDTFLLSAEMVEVERLAECGCLLHQVVAAV